MHRLHLTICGKVQGVGFRYFVWFEARELGLAGWVRNRPDGAVEVTAEGAPAALGQLRARVHAGPTSARVTEVAEEWSEGPPRFSKFEITG